MIVIVMGVSGSGKSSLGQALAAKMDWTFIEGDDRHPAANRAKMAAGIPLSDADRWPWLDALAAEATRIEAEGGTPVLACSALRRAYRERLRASGSHVCFLHLTGPRETIAGRMAKRTGHYMPLALLDSQLATLEPAAADEMDVWTLPIDAPVEQIAEKVAAAFTSTTSIGSPLLNISR